MQHDQARLLGERDEVHGLDQTAGGMVPSNQRLEPLDLARLEHRSPAGNGGRTLSLSTARCRSAFDSSRRSAVSCISARRPDSGSSPLSFAMYIATSALRSSSSAPSGPAARRSAVAIPMLARTKTSFPSRWNGPVERREDPSGDVGGAHALAPSSSRTANSSPPSRAAVSGVRRHVRRRSPTSPSRRSPAAWPRESLIVLKSSRSMNRTDIGRSSRVWRSSACSTRSRNNARLARPVIESWKAWCASCSSNALRSDTSRELRTIPFTFGIVQQVGPKRLHVEPEVVAVPHP